jgi:hypothetical protein
MSQTGPDERGAVVRRSVLDLSHLTSPEELAAITRIERVGLVIVPESLASAYATIPATRVANTVFVPAGARVRAHTGQLVVGGDGLGGPQDVLVIVGALVVTSPVTGPVPQRISVVGSVLAPQGSESALGPALAGGVGVVGYYRYVAGQEIQVLSGQVRLIGASLANSAGSPDDVLLALGQVVVTGAVSAVGYAQVVVAGQLVAPAAAQELLTPRLRVQGQTVWTRTDQPRVIMDDTEYGPDFFRLLDGPISLVVLGDLTLSPGVTEAMVLEKIVDLALLGDLYAPAALIPALQVRTSDALGSMRVTDGPAG